ncbi:MULTISPECIES: YbaB/EbfC family nucleoid-associated protein [unclassified Streptosporangium]|uniref:YbaB/EbfC family nucleoid-associated protein n=1 Tax=unclassified Streptosporangium TaxID=2632669 RepID=UPI00332FFF35
MTTADGRFGRTGNPEVDQLAEGFDKLSARYERMREELTEMRAHGEAADGLVKVEVAPGGALLGVDINPRAMRLGSEALGEAIMEAVGEASKMAAARMDEVLAPLLGGMTGFSEALQGRMPTLDPEGGLSADPRVAEALRNLREMRDKYQV